MKKKPKSGWNYFDDCAICGAMRRADEKGASLSAQELSQAFDEQNRTDKGKDKRKRPSV